MKKVETATAKHARRFVISRWSNVRDVRRHVGVWALAIGLLIAAAGLQVYWYQQSYRTTAYATGGTYAEGVLGPVSTLNPIFASTSAEEAASTLMFSRLLTHDSTGKLNYDLATSLKESDDHRTYTVTLRPDAQWHDGVYVRAKDVVYTVNLIKNTATRSTISGWGDIVATAVDDVTVNFRLPSVYAAFPQALSYLPILPEHILRDVEPSAMRENDFSNAPIGSGPFSLRFVQGFDKTDGRKIIHLARNDSYFKGKAKLDRFQLHVYGSAEAIVRGLNTSEINSATDLSITDTLSVNPRYKIEKKPVNSGVYALFNTTTGPLSDVAVRRALQAGTDTTAARKAVSDQLPALSLPFIDGQVKTDVTVPKYDTKRAAQLLDDAGWRLEGDTRKKEGKALKISLVTTKNNDLEKVLQELTGQWRKLGVSVTTNIVDPTDPAQNVVQDILQPRNYDALLYRLTIGGDPDVYAYWHSSQASRGLNFSNYAQPIVDDALASARTVTTKALRDAKYSTVARQWVSDVPAIGIYQATAQYAYTDAVHATLSEKKYVTSTDRYSDVLYWTVGSRVVHRTP